MLEFKFIYGSDGYNTAKEFMKEMTIFKENFQEYLQERIF